ncbi:MAG TPA: 16S rRNA (cytosine(1402)-N(4))-methyltransferase [Syntrophaceae bacterium]|jgi:16S rRNA (cytosine1402-N4)-methyltransferase|nr:16S rRNA (cytosine(1402)-N(4))-methyltransferase [Syntrophaceae bacterium]
MHPYHTPVMQREVIESLRCRPGGIYVDGTVGGGGHASEILRITAPDGVLIGIDVDDDALRASEEQLKPFGDRKILVKGNFADIHIILDNLNIKEVDGILLDLGVSSYQLRTADRGFSFSLDAALDMRMDQSHGPCAYDIVNTFPEKDLERIIRDYGEEIMADRIVKMISARRKVSPIKTTAELAGVVVKALPSRFRSQKIHPATKTFQAIRIYVNNELLNLYEAINHGVDMLKISGRLSIISFHSLEDRIVKNNFRSWQKGCLCPTNFPMCICQRKAKLKIVTKRPVIPNASEIETNPRARSAKLRTAERI